MGQGVEISPATAYHPVWRPLAASNRPSMITVLTGSLAALIATWVGILLWNLRPLVAYWREPAFRLPVLVFESDDWGPAPDEHAQLLSEIGALLGEFRDDRGHHPVMTLGVVLAVPESSEAFAANPRELTLPDQRFRPIVDAMQLGVRNGVFRLHLHGRSHYWLEALTDASRSDPTIAHWLAGPESWRTEALPPGLQTRWAPEIRGVRVTMPAEAVRKAAEAEARLFAECFGAPATVAVPTTFVWNPDVVRGWAVAGIRAIVTPGRYYRHRGQFAHPSSAPLITNGMRSQGTCYVVRDRYFEPFKGHSAEQGLRALAENTALGRPTLLEIHRVNFLEGTLRERTLSAIRGLLSTALVEYPNLRFLPTIDVVNALEATSSEILEQALPARVATWCRRVKTLRRFWTLARISGLAALIAVTEKLAQRSS